MIPQARRNKLVAHEFTRQCLMTSYNKLFLNVFYSFNIRYSIFDKLFSRHVKNSHFVKTAGNIFSGIAFVSISIRNFKFPNMLGVDSYTLDFRKPYQKKLKGSGQGSLGPTCRLSALKLLAW